MNMNKIAIGCAISAVATLLIVVVIIACFFLFSDNFRNALRHEYDSSHIRESMPLLGASLSLPSNAALDETVTMVVTVTNTHKEPVALDSIDVDNSFLEGFQVIEIIPKPKSTQNLYEYYQRSWDFSQDVAPGDSVAIQFRLKAVVEGHFSGDVDVCNPNQDFKTLLADVVVRDEP